MINSNIFVNASMMEFSKISDYPSTDNIKNAIISNGKVVNMVSDSYGFISNQDFFGGFEQKLRDEHINFEARYKNYDDVRFTADYILEGSLLVKPEFQSKYAGTDMIKPKLRLTHSYDGKTSTAGYFGFFRQVCSNGLHVSKEELAFKTRRTKANIEIIYPTMSEMIENYKKNEQVSIIRKFEVLAEKTISKSDLIKVVNNIVTTTDLFKFEKSDKNIEPSKNAQFVLDVIAKESEILNTKPNAWIVYNAMNEWIYSDERNKKNDDMRRNLDIKVFNKVEQMFL